ncbi:hypothetical protein FJZ31_02035 [Candidatus Poribacteria bacterium]|nr:hypothetical protein [Candidatus Poribacteria bacterium]
MRCTMINFRCFLLIVSLIFVGWSCTTSEDSDDFSTIEELPYAVGTNFDADAVYNNLNENAQADWIIKEITIKSDSELSLSMELHYRSSPPLGLTFVGSAVFLKLSDAYRRLAGLAAGEVRYSPLLFAPITIQEINSRRWLIKYTGAFETPEANVEYMSLESLRLAFAWVRVYQNAQGEYFYEWAVSNNYYSSENLDTKVGIRYKNIPGDFRLYNPVPESETNVLYIFSESTDYFNYVAWLKAHI